MIAHALSERPLECCGLLAGPLPEQSGSISSDPPPAVQPPLAQVVKRYPLANNARSATEYFCADRGLFDAHRDMRRLGLDVLAIYHSHPTTAAVPSRTDLERNNYPGAIHFIISLRDDPPVVQGWWLLEKDFREAEWECVD
jgi:proteasome lid subunit RPN8/RPN11